MRGGCKRYRRNTSNSHLPQEFDARLSWGSDGSIHSHLATGIQGYAHCSDDSHHVDKGSSASRCSVRLIHEVVSKFDDRKRQLVESTGFGGLLYFPAINQINRKFVLWLMSRVDETSGSIVVRDHIRIRFTREDVGAVLGIPCSGKDVLDPRIHCRDAKHIVLHEYMGVDFKEHRSIRYLQDILERRYVYPMSKHQEDVFRVAFVIFVCSTLLAPSSKHDYASIDYWNAIENPDTISSYDWGSFVIAKLTDAVIKLKKDVSSSIKFPSICGCSLFLQVFYLDSLELHELSMPHDCFPRARVFVHDKFRAMIASDKNFRSFNSPDDGFVISKLREKSGCCYVWACSPEVDRASTKSGCLLALWNTSVAMARLLNIPLEAAGPLFVAAADFQEKINSGFSASGYQVMKFMNVLVSIMLPYSKGFRYDFSLNNGVNAACEESSNVLLSSLSSGAFLIADHVMLAGKKHPLLERVGGQRNMLGRLCSGDIPSSSKSCDAISRHEQSSFMSASVRVDDIQNSYESVNHAHYGIAHDESVTSMVAAVMSKFYSLARKMKAPSGIDLNSAAYDDQIVNVSCPVSSIETCSYLPSPWNLGYSWSTIGVDVSGAIMKLQSAVNNETSFIIHRSPKTIHVSGNALYMQLLGKSEMELDLFDAILRTVKDVDDQLYSDYGNLRWRHFFESDFMAAVLSGNLRTSDAEFCDQLQLHNMHYDLSKSQLLFFPALLEHRWVCYVWCLESNVITIFDPTCVSMLCESSMEVHGRCCNLLKIALQLVGRYLGGWWEYDWLSAKIRTFTSPDSLGFGMNRSGLLCALFCMCFNGVDVVPMLQMEQFEGNVAKMFCDLLKLKGNCGSIPSSFM